MSYEDRSDEARDARSDALSFPVEKSRTETFLAAEAAGVPAVDTDEMALLAIPRFLLADSRRDPVPTPEVARLRREWDYLVTIDDEADAAEEQTTVPAIPLVLHSLPTGGRHRCGLEAVYGVTLSPHPSGVSPYDGKYRSSPRPNCPGCCR